MNFGFRGSSGISRRERQPTGGEDALTFAESVGFRPDELQARLLEEDSHRLLLNCTR